MITKTRRRDPGELEQLASTIESEIVPRLLMAHALPQWRAAGASTALPTPTDVAEFTRLILQHDVEVALAYINIIRARGCALENILLDLLAPSARTLGDLWSADLSDFGEVTVAIGRMQDVLHRVCPSFTPEPNPAAGDRRVLLAPVPGEQHTLGVSLVREFFRQSGWDVVSTPRMSAADLGDVVHDEWFSVAGLSLACERQLDDLADTVKLVRRASINKNIGILVGGPLLVEHPHLTSEVGADATAVDARSATVAAAALHAARPRRDGPASPLRKT
jgi:methanogenic corrinoid protein MtbC1